MEYSKTHRYFEIGILLKGLHAAIELITGVLLLVIQPNTITDFVIDKLHEELREDPADTLSNFLLPHAQSFVPASTHFAAWYLISHGVVKAILVWGLLKEYLWAFPLSLAALSAFVVYQIYRFVLTGSLYMIGLTIFDAVIIWLIWREYMERRKSTSR